MNFDLDNKNYTKQDCMEIFNLDKDMNITPQKVKQRYEKLLKDIEKEDFDSDSLKNFKTFLKNCYDKLVSEIEENINNYKLINTDFTTNLNVSETFQSNNKFVIKKDGEDSYHTNKINPFSKTERIQLLNINTRFRKNYYDTKSTDFVIDLPEEFKNVTSITVVSVQIPNSCYNFTSTLGTNEFTIELFDLSGSSVVTGSQQIKTIKISNGIYTGKQLENYLNTFVLSIEPLNRIGCKYDEITRKFRFFRDYRPLADGGLPVNPTGVKHCFNLDFRTQDDLTRPIQLNMGWILGYRQQYYNWESDYTENSEVSYITQEGYNPEAIYDNLGCRYFILCINDFNKNYSNTLTSPFQESTFNNENAIAKIPSNPNMINFSDIFYQSRRSYFGPVDIKKLHIQIMDEFGRVIDLNNNDFSFSLQIKQLYDVHANKNI